MNVINYKLIGDFPKCRTCGRTMDYWDLRSDWSTFEHPACSAKRIGEEIGEIMRKMLNGTK